MYLVERWASPQAIIEAPIGVYPTDYQTPVATLAKFRRILSHQLGLSNQEIDEFLDRVPDWDARRVYDVGDAIALGMLWSHAMFPPK